MNITSKYRSLSVQAKAALWFTICSFLQKGISFITVPIFTRLMSTEEYGIGCRKGSDLTDYINKEISKFYSDGTMEEIGKKYGVQEALITK